MFPFQICIITLGLPISQGHLLPHQPMDHSRDIVAFLLLLAATLTTKYVVGSQRHSRFPYYSMSGIITIPTITPQKIRSIYTYLSSIFGLWKKEIINKF